MASGELLWSMMLFILVLFTAREAFGYRTCSTPTGNSGNCINIRQCEAFVKILQKQPLSARSIEFLRSSQCGFDGRDPKVCCEIQRHPDDAPEPKTPGSSTPPPPPDVSNHPNLRLLDTELCGPITEPKISGGNKTSVFEFPWMALLFYSQDNGEPEVKCGGTLINERYVLTAAHCVKYLPGGLRLVKIRLGEHDLSKERDCERQGKEQGLVCAERYQDFQVQSSHPHPDFSLRRKQNDIALIRINREANFRLDSVRPICLPIGEAAAFTRKKAIVTGWGATEFGPRSDDLLKVSLPIVQNDQCSQIYEHQPIQIWYKHMCAGGVSKLDSCSGDSGGPLQAPAVVDGQPRFVQYGVVSFGLSTCGIGVTPGIYTRVSYYTDWILDTIRD